MTQRFAPSISLIGFLLLGLGVATPSWGLPRITNGPDAVEVSDLPPGGSVALYALLHEWTGWSSRISEIADVLTDDDADGTVRYELGREVPPVSVWLAVDLTTGEVAVSGSDDFTPRELTFPPGVLRRGLGNRLNRLEMTGRIVHAFVVRPSAAPETAGAWLLRLGDGGERDDDGANDGKMGFALEHMTPVAASPLPPEEIEVGDVIALVDPDTLDFVVAAFAAPGDN